MKDWAEVQRLHHREGRSERAVARELGLSRNTVHRLLSLPSPSAYERSRPPSLLDQFRDTVLALLDKDPMVRPQFLAARTYWRMSYLPGESDGGENWIRFAHFPQVKTLDDFAFCVLAL